MRSYASIERFSDEFVLLEIELSEIEVSGNMTAYEKNARSVIVPLTIFQDSKEEYCEGDILVVEHNNGLIIHVLGKDLEEKKRRVERLKNLKELLKKKF